MTYALFRLCILYVIEVLAIVNEYRSRYINDVNS